MRPDYLCMLYAYPGGEEERCWAAFLSSFFRFSALSRHFLIHLRIRHGGIALSVTSANGLISLAPKANARAQPHFSAPTCDQRHTDTCHHQDPALPSNIPET